MYSSEPVCLLHLTIVGSRGGARITMIATIGRGNGVSTIAMSIVLISNVTRARDRELEGVNVESFLIGVSQEADKVVLLQALRIVLVVNVGARGGRVHALLKTLGLSVLLVSLAVSLGVVLIGQIDNDLPLAVSIDGSSWATVEDVRGTNVATRLVIVGRVRVSLVVGSVLLVLLISIVMLVSVTFLLSFGEAINEVISGLVGNITQQTLNQMLVTLQLVLNGLTWVIVVLETEGKVVVMLVGISAFRDLGHVVLVGGVSMSLGVLSGMWGQIGIVVGIVGGEVSILCPNGIIGIVALIRVAMDRRFLRGMGVTMGSGGGMAVHWGVNIVGGSIWTRVSLGVVGAVFRSMMGLRGVVGVGFVIRTGLMIRGR